MSRTTSKPGPVEADVMAEVEPAVPVVESLSKLEQDAQDLADFDAAVRQVTDDFNTAIMRAIEAQAEAQAELDRFTDRSRWVESWHDLSPFMRNRQGLKATDLNNTDGCWLGGETLDLNRDPAIGFYPNRPGCDQVVWFRIPDDHAWFTPERHCVAVYKRIIGEYDATEWIPMQFRIPAYADVVRNQDGSEVTSMIQRRGRRTPELCRQITYKRADGINAAWAGVVAFYATESAARDDAQLLRMCIQHVNEPGRLTYLAETAKQADNDRVFLDQMRSAIKVLDESTPF